MKQRVALVALLFVSLALAAIPILHMAGIVSSTGVSSLISFDYLVIPTVLRVMDLMDGSVGVTELIGHSFVLGTDGVLFPMLVWLGIAKWSHWNTFVELWVGFSIALANVGLIWAIAARTLNRWAAVFAVVPAAWLVFSKTQIDTFVWGPLGIPAGLNLFGLLVATVALAYGGSRWRGVVILAIGAIIAAFSGHAGPIVWPIAILAAIAMRWQWRYIFATIGGMVLTAALMIPHFSPEKHPDANPPDSILAAIGPLFRAIGIPMRPEDWSHNLYVIPGIIGVALVAVLILGVALIDRQSLRQLVPAGMLLSYGLMDAMLVVSARGYARGIHVTGIMAFWIGAIIVFATLITPRIRAQSDSESSMRPIQILAGAALVISFVFYFLANQTEFGKSSTLQFRAPIGASCERLYHQFGSICEDAIWVFEKDTERFKFSPAKRIARIKKHKLSVFSPHQHWYLQGDGLLPIVSVDPSPRTPKSSGEPINNSAYWMDPHDHTIVAEWIPYKDGKLELSQFATDPDHLILGISSGTTVAWQLELPKNLKSARFESTIRSANPSDAAGLDWFVVDGKHDAADDLESENILGTGSTDGAPTWKSVHIDLTKFAGKTVTLYLLGPQDSSVDDLQLQFPEIDIHVN